MAATHRCARPSLSACCKFHVIVPCVFWRSAESREVTLAYHKIAASLRAYYYSAECSTDVVVFTVCFMFVMLVILTKFLETNFVRVRNVFPQMRYCCLHILRRGYPDWGFSVLFTRLQGKCQGITSQDVARPLFQNCCVVLCIVCFISFYVLFVCKCVLYYCHRVTTQLQLTNISYHIIFPVENLRALW